MTIQIYLPSGDPQGIRIAEITTRTVRILDVPRTEIVSFFEMPESDQVAVYYLFGDEAGDQRIQCYIGRTNAARQRFRDHLKAKDFWTHALISISRTNTKTDTHAGYLEWKSIQEANEAGRFAIINGNVGSRPHTPEPLQAECEEIFDTISILIATMGFPLFQKLSTKIWDLSPVSERRSTDVEVFCEERGAKGRGIYSSDGLTIFKGSRCAAEPTKSVLKSRSGVQDMRARFMEDGTLALVDGAPVFQRDTLFKSPSGASELLLFKASNGWTAWKTEQGDSLNEAIGRKIQRRKYAYPVDTG